MQAVVLARVSTKEQEEGHSLSAQLNRLHDYCNRRGLDIIQEFTIVESSTRGERPEFQKLIAFIKKQPHKVALIKLIDYSGLSVKFLYWKIYESQINWYCTSSARIKFWIPMPTIPRLWHIKYS